MLKNASVCYAQDFNLRKVTVFSDSGSPVPNALVKADFRPDGPLIEGFTDSFGVWQFKRSGAFALTVVESMNYKGFNQSFTIRDLDIKVVISLINHEFDPVTITATDGPRATTKNPYMVRIIGRDKIEKMAAQTLGDVLTNEVNITLGQDAVMGTSAILQGIGGQDIKILINGIPVIGRQNGNIDISQILLTNVERIEIIEGPMSVVYGTDALGGVINIITKNPLTKPFNATLNAYQDNLENYNYDGNITVGINKRNTLSTTLGRYFFRGLDFDPTNRLMDWKPKTKWFGDLAWFVRRDNSTHRIALSGYNEKLTDRSNAEYSINTITGYNSLFYTNRLDLSTHSVFKGKNGLRFELLNGINRYSRIKTTYRRNLVTGEETLYRLEDQDISKFSLYMSRGILSKTSKKWPLHWLLGYEANHEGAKGQRLTKENAGITDIAMFSSLEYSPDKKLLIRPSVRVITNSKYGMGNGYMKIAPLIPSIQLKYNLSDYLIFRGSWSRGFRAPSIKELYFLFVDVNHNIKGNENLDAELSSNFVLSLDYRKKAGKEGFLQMNYSLFLNLIEDKINIALADANTNLYTYINVGRYRTQGLSLNVDYRIKNWSYGLGYSIIGVLDLLETDTVAQQQYYYLNQLRFNTSYHLKNPKITFSLFNKYAGPTVGYNADNTRYRTSDFFLMDFTIQKILNKRRIALTAGIKNVLGVTSVQTNRIAGIHDQSGNSVLVQPGRSYFLRLSYNIDNLQ